MVERCLRAVRSATSHTQVTLFASCCNASWLHGWADTSFENHLWSPLRPGMEIDGFMFHDMLYWHTAPLPSVSLPHLWFYTAIFNPIFQNWQPYIIHILLSPLFFSLFLSVFTHFLQSLCTSPSTLPTPTPNPTCRLHPAPLCRKVARLFSGAPDKGSFYFWCGFERIENVSQCVWAIMIVAKLLRMNQPDKCTGGKKMIWQTLWRPPFLQAISFPRFISKLKMKLCIFYRG